jgi:hypothetical protein
LIGGFAAGSAAGDSATEDGFESGDELGCAKRPAGAFGVAQVTKVLLRAGTREIAEIADESKDGTDRRVPRLSRLVRDATTGVGVRL